MEGGNTRAIFSEFQKAQKARSVRGAPNNRLLDGMSTSLTRKLDTMSRQELIDLKDRNENLLNNPSLVSTLPDKGTKLKTSIEQINALLQKQDIAKGMSELSINPSPDMRKRSIDQANALANKNRSENSNTSLLASHSKKASTEQHSKTQMMSMDESMKLQEDRQQQVKEEKIRRQLQALKPQKPQTSESLADDLSLSLTRMQLDPETGPHRPQDDDPGYEYDEPDSDDLDSIDEANYDSLYDDDEGFDEESENER